MHFVLVSLGKVFIITIDYYLAFPQMLGCYIPDFECNLVSCLAFLNSCGKGLTWLLLDSPALEIHDGAMHKSLDFVLLHLYPMHMYIHTCSANNMNSAAVHAISFSNWLFTSLSHPTAIQ